MNEKIKNNTIKPKFEFLFKINGNIICQRNFNIPKYNKAVLKSDELKEMMDIIAGMNNTEWGQPGILPKFLKDESKRYLWKKYNPHIPQTIDDINHKDIFKNEDIFTVEIKSDKHTIASSMFSGNWFPTAVRYHVNINGKVGDEYDENRNIIPKVIDVIKEYFTRTNYHHRNTQSG